MAAELANSIRKLADMVAEMPDAMDENLFLTPSMYVSVEEARKIMGLFPGGWKKYRHQNQMTYYRSFDNGITLYVYATNPSCTRVQVGEKVIEAQPERIEPIFEWQCPDGPSDE